MKIQKDISLKGFNTFGIDAKAKYLIEINNLDDIKLFYQSDYSQIEKKLILGAGSNILFVNDYDGLIIKINNKGISIKKSEDDYILLEAAAGENWHNFVSICLKNKYYGLENLALIPGTVGAAPVQNIGAYGVEQCNSFYSVTGYNLNKGTFQTYFSEECNFSYRNSIFKGIEFKDFIITSVTYKLSRVFEPILNYKELAHEVNKFGVKNPDALYIYDTICRIRKAKLPDYEKIGNAGSFFKNPIINSEDLESLKSKNSNIPYFANSENTYKIPAAWLIEKCGFKGFRLGNAGVYDKHSLILVNYGNASGSDIIKLSDIIISEVYQKFGIKLEPEVRIIY